MHKSSAKEFILKEIIPLLKINKEDLNCLDLRINESGLDSLELMELVMSIEDKYSVHIDDAILMNASITIGEFIDLVAQLTDSPE
jgi:acyl carrier protein